MTMLKIGVTQRAEYLEAVNETRDALDQNWTNILQTNGCMVVPIPNACCVGNFIEALSLDGIKPCKETIKNDTYPYVTEVMGSVRSDIDKSSTAYQLFYNLSIGKYNNIIDESGYVVRTKK